MNQRARAERAGGAVGIKRTGLLHEGLLYFHCSPNQYVGRASLFARKYELCLARRSKSFLIEYKLLHGRCLAGEQVFRGNEKWRWSSEGGDE